MSDLIEVALLIFAGLALYAMRRPILAALRRFDARNIARRQQEVADRHDQLAHYKHTLRLAEEQVEEIHEFAGQDERTAQPVTRYVFEGETYASRDEAEAARQQSIVGKARAFYVELPAALIHRGKGKLN